MQVPSLENAARTFMKQSTINFTLDRPCRSQEEWRCSTTISVTSARWCSWIGHCAISRKVAGSIPVALGSTQLLTEMSTRNISGGGALCMADNFTTFICRLTRNSGSLNLLEPSGAVQACTGIAVPQVSPIEKFSRYLIFVKISGGTEQAWSIGYFQALSENCEKGLLASSCLSVRMEQ